MKNPKEIILIPLSDFITQKNHFTFLSNSVQEAETIYNAKRGWRSGSQTCPLSTVSVVKIPVAAST